MKLGEIKVVDCYFRAVLRVCLGGATAAGEAWANPDSDGFLEPLLASAEVLTFLPPRVESVFRCFMGAIFPWLGLREAALLLLSP